MEPINNDFDEITLILTLLYISLSNVRLSSQLCSHQLAFISTLAAGSLERDSQKGFVVIEHLLSFGDHVVLLGSAKELSSWKTNVPLNWTQNGWVRDFHFKGGDHLEFKFIIVKEMVSQLDVGCSNFVTPDD
ncbi:hypothetical protein TSUD_173460 [Trifolium subterraneum]|nr:hypothetical protein TSUD_173460 [Trifolium subterraneum]